jgi:hypothetical protein
MKKIKNFLSKFNFYHDTLKLIYIKINYFSLMIKINFVNHLNHLNHLKKLKKLFFNN